MNKAYCSLAAGVFVMAFHVQSESDELKRVEAVELNTLEQKISYLIGFSTAKQIDEAGIAIDVTALKSAFDDVKVNAKLRLSEEELHSMRITFQSLQREAINANARAENMAVGRAFLQKNAQREEVTQTRSGLQYEILQSGGGAAPAISDSVLVNYHGTFVDGRVFDSSKERGEPVTFPLNGVIRGWTEVLQLMQEGDVWKVYLPYDLAYPNGTRDIPPGSTLVFELALIKVLQPEVRN